MWVCFSGWRCMCKLGLIMSKSSWKWREERLTLSGEMLFHSIPSIPLCISSLYIHDSSLWPFTFFVTSLAHPVVFDWLIDLRYSDSSIFTIFLSCIFIYASYIIHADVFCFAFEGSKTESLGEIHLVSQKLMSRGVNNTVMARQACWKQSMRKQPKVSHWANLNLVRGFWSLPLSRKRLMV